jgi:hypothetical protein
MRNYMFFKIFFAVLVFQYSSHGFAMNTDDFEDRKKALSVTFKLSVTDKGLSKEEIKKVTTSIKESEHIDAALTVFINELIGHGVSSSDVDHIVTNFGYAIPRSAKIDYGLHDIVLGRSSLLGSLRANAKSIWNNGLMRWGFENGPTLMGYMATVQLISGMLTPAAAEVVTPESMCPLPEGPWVGSCHNTTVAPYRSMDPNVPVDSCVLTTRCTTIIPSIPPVENEFFFKSTSDLTLDNRNGTLTIQNSSGGFSPLVSNQAECTPLPGSHHHSCEISVGSYTSIDPRLADTPFCEMRSTCAKLTGDMNTQNLVYYGHEQLRGQEVVAENCDGMMVIHDTHDTDGMCAGKDESDIREISAQQGNTHHVLKN